MSGDVSFDFGSVFDRSRTVSDGIVKGRPLPDEEEQDHRDRRLRVFRDAKTIVVGDREITFDDVIIDTGSTVKLPPVELSDNVVTYETQIPTRDLPDSIAIVGAGAIGMEFGYVLANYGVDVTIIEFPIVLPNEDADVSKEIAKQYKKLGVKLLTSTKVQTVTDNGSSVTVTYADAKDQPGELTVDRVLMSVGFAPRVTGFGLENTGVALTEARRDRDRRLHAHQRAGDHHAIGDVTAKLQLAHVAEAQGIVAAETISGRRP